MAADIYSTNRRPQVGDKVATPDGRVIQVKGILQGGRAYSAAAVRVVHPDTPRTADTQKGFPTATTSTASAGADGDTVIWGSLGADGDTVIWGS